ncbi:MAG: hypothetical protein WAQ28_13370 [Bacteroidia bacterium]|jgi:hypothetical protein
MLLLIRKVKYKTPDGFSLFILLILFFGFQTDNGFDTYCNKRFHFCIDYPKDFIPQGESYNQDGQIFISKDSLTEIRAYGAHVMDESETASDHFAACATGIKVSYKVIKDGWFIFSGIDKNGKIVYEKPFPGLHQALQFV